MIAISYDELVILLSAFGPHQKYSLLQLLCSVSNMYDYVNAKVISFY